MGALGFAGIGQSIPLVSVVRTSRPRGINTSWSDPPGLHVGGKEEFGWEQVNDVDYSWYLLRGVIGVHISVPWQPRVYDDGTRWLQFA